MVPKTEYGHRRTRCINHDLWTRILTDCFHRTSCIISLYGAVKKRLTIHPFSSIALEAWLVTPIALWYLATIDTSSWVFLENVTSTGLLLIGSGLTTSIPPHPLLVRRKTFAIECTRIFTIPISHHGIFLGHLLLWWKLWHSPTHRFWLYLGSSRAILPIQSNNNHKENIIKLPITFCSN